MGVSITDLYWTSNIHLKNERIKLNTSTQLTICQDRTEEGLKSGFDADGEKVYSYLDFDLSQLPDPDNTMITECSLRISAKNTFKRIQISVINVELVDMDEVASYEDIQNRDKIEYIGYEVAESDLGKNDCQYFNFDTFSKNILDAIHQEGKNLKLVIKPTSAVMVQKSRIHRLEFRCRTHCLLYS